ncbi:MAG TPA: hypothetical protein VN663_21710 [Ramlibacter sp.]|nr:hypothetical protein [Ramlibacter sp.]
MASIANTANPSLQYLMVRAELAQQSFEQVEFTIELLTRLVKSIVAAVRPAFKRWAAAHRQAVQDRMFCELALTDHRLMADLYAIKDYAESRGDGLRGG